MSSNSTDCGRTIYVVLWIFFFSAHTFKMALDLRRVTGFPKFKKSVDDLPVGEPVTVSVSQYDILVGYERLMCENKVSELPMKESCPNIRY